MNQTEKEIERLEYLIQNDISEKCRGESSVRDKANPRYFYCGRKDPCKYKIKYTNDKGPRDYCCYDDIKELKYRKIEFKLGDDNEY